MLLNQDFKDVFGGNLLIAGKRLYKGISVLKGMMMGADIASTAMPIRLQVEVTDRCNYDCIMCNRLTRKNIKRKLNSALSPALFEELATSVKPFYITLNGLGEPLLHGGIDKILSTCRRKNITTSMPCNLSVPDILNSKIVKCPPSIITFSIHGASQEVFESISRKANYEGCLVSLRRFLSSVDRKTVIVRVLCALQAGNLLEYKNMYDLLADLGLLDSFILVPVYDYGQDEQRTHQIIPTEEEKENAIKCVDKEIELCKDAEERYFYLRWKSILNQITARTDAFIADKINDPCLIPWFSSYIAANGNVLPCCYLLDEDYVMGNIFDQSFESIWNGEAYRGFRSSLRENRKLLRGCNYCSRSDLTRIKKYGFPFRRTMLWKI